MIVPITDQIAEIERYRNGLQGFVDNGVEPKEGPPAAVRLDRAEAALLTLRTYEAFEDEITQSTSKGR